MQYDFVEIATTGNGKDFGDNTSANEMVLVELLMVMEVSKYHMEKPHSIRQKQVQFVSIRIVEMEIYDGNQWTGILSTSPEQQTGGTRGCSLSGAYHLNTDNLFNIATTGQNATDFGDFSSSRYLVVQLQTRTRGSCFGGVDHAQIRFFIALHQVGRNI